ncbi:hypothetical protein, partial [Enterobacter roggenkampii]|uniref:hypothetical protein n=1 Tax=Enterobacter roggenkampii TaxID=1812935 RepID=UPI0013D34E41
AEAIRDPARAEAIAAKTALRLDAIAEEMERGWEGRFDGQSYVFSRTVRGVKEVAVLDAALLSSAEARRIDEHSKSLGEVYD